MSPQTNYDSDLVRGVAGQKANARHDDYVMSRAAEEVTPFGVVVASVSGSPEKGRPPIANTGVILDDGGTWTATNYTIVVCGVTVTQVWGTSKAVDMAAIATAIQALDFITTAAYAGTSLTIVAKANVNLTLTTDVTALTGTMTITSITYAMTDRLLGLSVRDTIEAGSSRVDINDRAVATLANDALAGSDIVNGTVNGVAITAITYATSEAVTLQLVANAIKTIAGVNGAVVDTTLRTITVSLNPGLPLDSVSLVVTDNALGAVAPSFSYAYSAQGVGIARNTAKFAPTETLPVLRKGEMYAQCEEAMTPASTAFVRIAATASFAQRGVLRTDIDSGNAVAATGVTVVGNSFTDPNGALVVPVELNLP